VRNASVIGRVAGIAAVFIAIVAVTVVLLMSGSNYGVTAVFQNASQLVKGDLVQVAGQKVGTVSDITLTSNGQAAVKLSIDSSFHIPEGTQMTVRLASLSGIANRYVDLQMPPARGGKEQYIANGGVIDASHTTSAVDLDEIFNIFGAKQRAALSGVFRGSATQYGARGPDVNAGLLYLNPAIASSSRLFALLNRSKPLLTNFVVQSARFVTDVAARSQDLSGLVDHLATTTSAIGSQSSSLSTALSVLPTFMRSANSTFVNLRSTLDDLDGLVNDSKPVARKLGPLLFQLRGLAHDAVPTFRDLTTIIKKPGPNNDLIDLTNSAVPLRNIAIGPVNRNGAQREGSFPASTKALNTATPEVAFLRPYAPDLIGWFNDFGTSGLYDAWGTASRAALNVNAFTALSGLLNPILPIDRAAAFNALAINGQNNRCPGSMERGSAFKPYPSFPCDLSQVPPGP